MNIKNELIFLLTFFAELLHVGHATPDDVY